MFAPIPESQIVLQKQQTSWRTKWDSNSRFGQRIFAFENSTEFRASIAKLGPRENFLPTGTATQLSSVHLCRTCLIQAPRHGAA